MKKRFLDVLKNADSFFVYNKGEKVKADRVEFLREFLKMAENCYYMPCIGVAKDDVMGRRMQDLNLPIRKRAPRKETYRI